MATKKTIFVAFAIEDERQRDFLKGQSLNTNSPFEYVDMSVKEAYDTDWKNKGGCQLNNDAISFQLPLTWNLAKSAIVRSTISRVLDTTIDFLLKRANQCLCLPLFCSRYTVCDLL